MSYIKDVLKSIERTSETNIIARNRSVQFASSQIIDATAVDTGKAKGGWQTSDTELTTDINRLDGTGLSPKQENANHIAKAKMDDDIWLVNNTPYVGMLETGTTKMRAQPMVAPVEANWKNIVRVNNK